MIAEELHRAARRHFPRRKVIADKIDQIWGADLMDFSKDSIYYKKKKYMYVLVNIDVFSKYCWCHVIKNKATENLIECYQELFQYRKARNAMVGPRARY